MEKKKSKQNFVIFNVKTIKDAFKISKKIKVYILKVQGLQSLVQFVFLFFSHIILFFLNYEIEIFLIPNL